MYLKKNKFYNDEAVLVSVNLLFYEMSFSVHQLVANNVLGLQTEVLNWSLKVINIGCPKKYSRFNIVKTFIYWKMSDV